MTPEQRRKLATLAGAIALEAPLRPNKWASRAYVSWDLIGKIRAVLDESGFDWRKAHAELKAAAEAERKESAVPPQQEPGEEERLAVYRRHIAQRNAESQGQ